MTSDRASQNIVIAGWVAKNVPGAPTKHLTMERVVRSAWLRAGQNEGPDAKNSGRVFMQFYVVGALLQEHGSPQNRNKRHS